jgi:hypothetical protein
MIFLSYLAISIPTGSSRNFQAGAYSQYEMESRDLQMKVVSMFLMLIIAHRPAKD